MRKLAVGKIIKPQGIKGECKFAFLTNDLSIFNNLKKIFIDDKEYIVKNIDIRFGFGYIMLQGINDRNKSELLRNKKIYILEEDFNIKDNEYLIDEILGFKIVNNNLKELGVLIDIEQYGAADVCVIEQYKREYRVPFLSSIFLKVDKDNKFIIIDENKYNEVKICD